MSREAHQTVGAANPQTSTLLGGVVGYDSIGAGPPILFVHTVIADRRMWSREVELFSKDHRSIRFDLRGFGSSPRASAQYSHTDDIKLLMDHLEIPRAFLVGSSMGGAIAIDFALEHPEMVRGLLLAAPGLSGGIEPPFDVTETAALEYDEKKSTAIAQAWTRGDRAAAFELLRQLWCPALDGPALELFRTMVAENAVEVFEGPSMQLAVAGLPAAGRLPSLQTPTTILIGDRDNPSSPPFAARIARAIPRARVVTIPGADHLINLSRPERFDRELRTALVAID